jgi:hypothetical protein
LSKSVALIIILLNFLLLAGTNPPLVYAIILLDSEVLRLIPYILLIMFNLLFKHVNQA